MKKKSRAGWGSRSQNVKPIARQAAEKLLREGSLLYNMDAAPFRELQSILKPDVDKLRRIAADAPDDIIITPPSNALEAQRILTEYCSIAGIFDALSAFYGANHQTADFVVHYSHPKDTWFRMFDDLGLDMPKTTQMHFDLAFSPPKAMLYLNEVGEEQGPFSIIPKSSDWEHFDFELAFKKEVLYGVSHYTNLTHGKSVRGNTSIFRFSEARSAFASLPKDLRGTSHPGDHILNETEMSAALLRAERKIIGDAGTMPLFAGSHVLHRGGLVRSGERIALQIIFSTQ